MSAIPEPWDNWLEQLSETLTGLDGLAHQYEAEITLPTPTDAMVAEEAAGITTSDDWHSEINDRIFSAPTRGLSIAPERWRFRVLDCFVIDEDLFSIRTNSSPSDFPSERLTDRYVRLLGLFGKLRPLPADMAQSLSDLSPVDLIPMVPYRYLLQDLLLTAGRSASLSRPQAILAIGLDWFVPSIFEGGMEVCRKGIGFASDTFSAPLDSAWDNHLRTVREEELLIRDAAERNGIPVDALDDAPLEQQLVWSYLGDNQYHEAAAILSHLLRKHEDDSECRESLGVGREEWWQWLQESVEELRASASTEELPLTIVSGLEDPVAQRIADRDEGHRTRLQDRLGWMWSELHDHTQRCLVEAEEQWSRASESWRDEDQQAFAVGAFARSTYAAIENETRQRLAACEQLPDLPATPGKLARCLENPVARGLFEDQGGDPAMFCDLAGDDLVDTMRGWRNSMAHDGAYIQEVRQADAQNLYYWLWGIGTQGSAWLVEYFRALPPSPSAE